MRAAFAEASSALGYDLWTLIQQGPAERLHSTEFTQPAMLTAGVALWRLWQARGGADPAEVSGHSLGEFTALVCAGALSLGAAADLVRFRGQAMQEAVPAGTGGMAAILGLTDEQVVACCAQAAQGEVVEAVNFNAPGQVVIAGARAAVERAIGGLQGGRGQARPGLVGERALALQPDGAGRPAAGRRGWPVCSWSRPVIRYVSAVDAAPHERAG